MSSLSYRNANIEDLSEIVAIYNSTIASRMVTADTEMVSVESKQKWFYEHNASTRPLWMVENNRNELVGWVSFQSFYGRPAYNATAEISIYLQEAQRKKGYGKQILQHCMETAPELGIKTLLGFIFAHNHPSLKLFKDLGFNDWATLPNIAMLDGQEFGLKILGKRIA
ncbi:N-acetyltransferase family protein [Flavobacterium sp. CBA20B-1]|uniref:GNAT family N-acetyltransferase n=1 Tax=unclassified Flavobacterium TaxID=196869 RepID=UPI0022257EA9|nr:MULTISPECIES: GNAT family N-acetyltransferase [unclassified Flavobacterium]WCM41403.1 N-acetyltransferase family protein [Flavobacterium sp. CBA20B-1]